MYQGFHLTQAWDAVKVQKPGSMVAARWGWTGDSRSGSGKISWATSAEPKQEKRQTQDKEVAVRMQKRGHI